jgi:hypothetical protein
MPDEPDRHLIPKHTIRMEDDLWDEFGGFVGGRKRADVLRQFVEALLGRPGVKMPRRKDYEPPQT